ncbi:hypothetical protein, partial [Clostridium tarantellae]
MDFSKKFSDTSFQHKDIVPLSYQSNDKVLITNFPDEKTPFYTPKDSEIHFKINKDRLGEITILEELIFKNVAKISFNANIKKLVVSSTGVEKNPQLKNTIYYLFKLRNSSNPSNIKLHSIIKADENANNFVADLNNKPFNFGDIIELEAYAENEITINNFPATGQSEDINKKFFNSETVKGFFKITTEGLQSYNPSQSLPTTILPNTIKINKVDNTPLIYLNFNILDKVIQAFSFGGNGDILSSYNYFIFKLYNSEAKLITTSILTSDGDISTFLEKIKLKSFNDDYILDLTYNEKSKSHIVFTNLNGVDHIPSDTRERYKITSLGLQALPVFLSNVININSINNLPVTLIKFNSIDKKLNVKSLNNISDGSSTYDYFKFNLYNETDVTLSNPIKTTKLISNVNATDFFNELNEFSFQYGQIIKLTYANMAMAHTEISNFPREGVNHIPSTSPEYYKITSSALITYTPPSNIFTNNFKFNSLNNSEMVKIKFDKATKRLVVTSTGVFYNGLASDTVFKFELKSGTTIKASATLNGNENGSNFQNLLNDERFEFGDNIVLTYLDKSKIILENYPDIGDNYNLAADNSQSFIITQSGITPILTPNKITVKSKSNEEVLTIEFNKETEQFIVSSTGIDPDTSSTEVYFTLLLKDIDLNTTLTATLNSNENGNKFKMVLNNKSFKFAENTLVLIYRDKTKIEISNYSSLGQTYVPNINSNAFKIFPDSLFDALLNNKIKIVNDNIEEIASLYFIKPLVMSRVRVIATATDAISTDTLQNNEKYVQFVKYNLNGLSLNGYAEILGKQKAKDFSNTLNDSSIQINQPFDIFRMSNKIGNRIIINDYKGQSTYDIGEEPEFLMITSSALVPHELNYNKIKFKNRNNKAILYIYFDKVDINNPNNIYIQPYSTGTVNTDSHNFYFKILDETETTIKIEGRINRNETGDLIKVSRDDSNISNTFNIGDILEVGCSNVDLVEVYDFPFTNVAKVLTESPQKFKITENGLVKFVSKSVDSQEIDFSNIAKVNFNSKTKQLKVISTGDIMAPALENTCYFLFKLRDSSNNIKNSSYIKADENGSAFANALNNTPFDFGDTIELASFTSDLIEIKNFPTQGRSKMLDGQFFNMDTYGGFFKITKKELQEFNPTAMLPTTTLPNTIKINKVDNTSLIELNFNTIDKVIQTFSFNGNGDSSSTYSYIIFKLYSSQNKLITTGTLTSNGNSSDFTDELNLKIFDYDYYIDLTYNIKAMAHIIITDLQGMDHVPIDTRERYKITPTALEPLPIFLKNIININSTNNALVTSIKFNFIDKKLDVKSLGNIADNTGVYDYVTFGLYNSTDTNFSNAIKTANLISNSNATAFSMNLNETDFDYGQLIKLTYASRAISHVKITNFPTNLTNHTPTEIIEYYKITNLGLEGLTSAISNIINIKNINNAPSSSIEFNITNKKLRVKSLINIPDSSSRYNYVTFNLYAEMDKSFSNPIETAELVSNVNPISFANILNNTDFDFNQIIKLTYDNKAISYVEITDFPSKGMKYTPNELIEYYKITSSGLELYPVFLKNTINIKDINNNLSTSIKFNFVNKKLNVTASNNIPDVRNNYDYFIFSIYAQLDIQLATPIKTTKLISDSNPTVFANNLNESSFEYNQIIKLTYADKSMSHIEITNFPSQGQNHIPNEIIEYYKITPIGLEAFPVFLKNTININSVNDNLVSAIRFDFINKQLRVVSSTNVSDSTSSYDYVIFNLYNKTDIALYNPIKRVKLTSNMVSTVFLIELDETNFDYEQLIELDYNIKSIPHIKITNFPSQGVTHTPNNVKEYYKITALGLEAYIPPIRTLPNNFVFNSLNNREMADVKFDKFIKTLVITSTGVLYNGQNNVNAFIFELLDNTTVKNLGIIKDNENAERFKNDLNNKGYDFGNIITLKYLDKTKVVLENYPNTGDIYTMVNEGSQKFNITPTGISPILIPNKITVKSKTNEEVLTIEFTEETKQFIVSSTGVVPDSTSNEPYFTLILKNENGNNLLKVVLKSNENGNKFKTALHGKKFKFTKNYLLLIYKEKNKIEISNYPSKGQIYIPQSNSDFFQILSTGLINSSLNSKIRIINDSNEEMCEVRFMKLINEIFISTTATDFISTNLLEDNEKYVQYVQYSKDNINLYDEILVKQSAKSFSNNLNENFISVEDPFDILRISNNIASTIIISNYKGQNQYKVGEEPEFLRVTLNELITHELNYNKVRFKNKDNSTILFIYFD